jgi:hypothetical protein
VAQLLASSRYDLAYTFGITLDTGLFDKVFTLLSDSVKECEHGRFFMLPDEKQELQV